MDDKTVADAIRDEAKHEEKEEDHRAPGTLVLTLVFLACFALYYFANWKALAELWHVR